MGRTTRAHRPTTTRRTILSKNLRTVKGTFDVRPISRLGDAMSRSTRHRRPMFLVFDDGYANTTQPLYVSRLDG